jgi:hypothetical protein
MRSILTLLFSCYAVLAFSQAAISDSGKTEFKKQVTAERPDYTIAYRILKNQVKLYPGNAELHYFLGYAADRMNSDDGNTLFQMKRDLTIEASEQFEIVNKLQPVYKGEYIVLDPYAKLSSIWGSLAQAYLASNMKDSAIWAFTEGKKRGGFIEPILHYNRQMLNSCSQNSILVTYGDNTTIPAWYLQAAENLRLDITIVDANLVSTDWYIKYLKRKGGLNISFTDEEIEKIGHIEFEPRYLTFTNPKDSSEKFTWQMRPTYQDKYILKGDRVMLNILKQYLFEKDIYFSSNSDSTWNLFLDSYLHDEGLVSRILPKGIELDEAPDSVSANLTNYSIEKLNAADINKSKDAIILLNNYRWAYYSNIARMLYNNQKTKARALKNEMELKFPLSKFPYAFERAADYFKELFEAID